MSVIAETEHARSEQLDNPESIYRACADMNLFSQEVLRVILLDTRYRHSSTVEITKAWNMGDMFPWVGRAEDGRIDDRYSLIELFTGSYPARGKE